MKTLVKRILILLVTITAICLYILTSAFRLSASESGFGEEKSFEEILEEFFLSEAQPVSVGPLVLPESSTVPSDSLAMQLLQLGSAMTEEDSVQLLSSAGFTILCSKHFDKSPTDPSHTCAFTISQGDVFEEVPIQTENLTKTKTEGKYETALLVVIRGTAGGEWYSNFDFCPSRNDSSPFAENFMFCAEDVFLSLKEVISETENPMPIIITGISRGAACANLLGVLLNEYCPDQDIYVYTFACPNTIRQDWELPLQNNVFNYINPSDPVPMVPLRRWGYIRAGRDIILPETNPAMTAFSEASADRMYEMAPTVSDYYETRHSLASSGESSFGLTAFELMLVFVDQILSRASAITISDGQLTYDPSETVSFSFPDSLDESDFSPLFKILEELQEETVSNVLEQLKQHFPSRYAELIQLKQEESDGLH